MKLKFPKSIQNDSFITRSKKPTEKRLVKLLDEAVSKLVIAIDKDCVQKDGTCKGQLTCGHLFSRRARSTRWDLINCNCQCWAHNYGHVHDTSKYTKWFLGHYGQDIWNALYDRFHTVRKWKRYDLECMLEDIKNQLKKYEQ